MLRILIVEDDSLQSGMYRDWLPTALSGMSDVVVALVSNGNDASIQLSNSGYDITILDIALPGKSGLDLYKEHKSNMGAVVLASSFGEVFKSSLNSSDKYFILNKPFSKKEFIEKMSEVIKELNYVNKRTDGTSSEYEAIE